MMFGCLKELTDLEIAALVGCGVLTLILIPVVIRLIRAHGWKSLVPIKWKEFTVPVPLPLLLIVLALVPAVGAGWWLSKAFPTRNFSFSNKTWTLGEIK